LSSALTPVLASPDFLSYSPPYVLPAHTSLIQSPLRTLSLFPDLYRDSRAICSFCSCASDYGCAYNCHKCPALCYTCDCSSSLGCRYNCDKCQGTAGGTIGQTNPPTTISTGQQAITVPEGCEGLQAEAELCTWGSICETIKNAQFPNCDYDCNTCKFSSNENEEGSEDEYNYENKELGEDKGENETEASKFPDSCSILENELKLCSWGPSCQTILDAQYSECNYNCDTCTLEPAESSPPPVAPVVADDNWGNTDTDNSEQGVSDVDGVNVWKPPPRPEAVEAEEDSDDGIPEECYQLVDEIDLCSWGPSCDLVKDTQFPQCNYNCATCKLESSGQKEIDDSSISGEDKNDGQEQAPPTAASTASEELLTLWEQFKPPSQGGSVVSSVESPAWGKPPPTSAVTADSEDSEEESDDDFTWADFESGIKTCKAFTGPGVGKTCKFPFKYDGVTYDSCAVLIQGDDEGAIGWCSTKVDINRYHISGSSNDKWLNVGFCDEKCFKNKK